MTLESVKDGLESLDLKIKCFNGKLSVDVYSKPTNSSTHVMSTACHPMKNINKVPQGIASSRNSIFTPTILCYNRKV